MSAFRLSEHTVRRRKNKSLRRGDIGFTLGGQQVVSGGYRYHTFKSSEYLTIAGDYVDAEILMIGGGGGAGEERSGGGGAGGHSLTTARLISGRMRVVVGAGGIGGVISVNTSTSGSPSSCRYPFSDNLMLNPSMETDASSWTTYGAHSVARSTAQAFVGVGSLQITHGDSSTLTDIYETVRRYNGTDYSIGQIFTYSAYFKAGTSSRGAYMFARCFNAAEGVTGEFASATITPVGGSWTRASVTFAIPANTNSIGMNVQFPIGAAGTTFMDAVMLESGSTLHAYTDQAILDATHPGGLVNASIAGGGRSGVWMSNGVAGASGGGGSGSDTTAPTGGAGTGGIGNNGGTTLQRNGTTWYSVAGGGGGAGAAGANGISTSLGQGGIGTDIYSTWASATGTGQSGYFCGGGTGGCDDRNTGSPTSLAGGLGGGGTGFKSANGGNALANTGGGGGGAGFTNVGTILRDGGKGGSGLVIVRVAV